MISDRKKVRQVFMEVADLPPADRAAAISKACAGDESLIAEVKMLLFADGETGVSSEQLTIKTPLALDGRTTSSSSRGQEGPGSKIGNYKLLQMIGEGGFGSVFMAQQEQPVQRKVALKIIKLGMDTRQVVARFEQERQALATMDHPNIAKVLDAGATETGRPYFVMELVKGDPIVEYCDKNNLSIDERLGLFSQVCNAVQHAHTKGIIHRDIKPSNILVGTQDGRPNTKVIDFGIAKATNSQLTEKTLFTEHRQLIGTPEYMSPEQAEGSLDIDTRTDVYSLGVLLYELLTGTTPFSSGELRSAAYAEIQRIIREVDPPKPSTRLSQNTETNTTVAARRHTEPRKLGLLLRGDLDWIVMKALEKDRQRRYETANGLAADIRRHLAGEAVVAAPPSAMYRIRKIVNRNKVAVSAALVVAAALLLGIVGTTWQARSARFERDRALVAEAETKLRAAELTEVSEFQAKMLSQIDATDAGLRLISSIRDNFGASLEKSGVPQAERESRARAFGLELFQVNSTDIASEMIDRTILKPAITAVDAQFKNQPLVDASLRSTLSQLYAGLGQSNEALILLQSAYATRKRELGESHPLTLLALNDLGSVLEASGKMDEAEKCYKQAYEGRLRVLGADHPDTLVSMGNLGNFYRGMGKADLAEPLLRTALETSRRVLGNEHRTTLIAMNTMGFLYATTGKLAEAEPLWREAYETGRKTLGDENRDVLVWVNNLGGLLQSQGKLAEAEPYLIESVERHRRILGDEHPTTIRATAVLGGLWIKRAMLDSAEPVLREASQNALRVMGPENPFTLTIYTDLGYLLRQRGKLTEAERYLREAWETRRRVLGPQHPETLDSVSNMAGLLADQGKSEEAEAMYRDALAGCRSSLGNDHPITLVQIVNLAQLLMNADRLEEAEVLVREALESRRRVSGEDHPETFIAMSHLARLFELQGKLDESESLYRDALDRFNRKYGPEHPNTLNGVGNLAAVIRKQQRPAEAEPMYRGVVDGLEKKYGKDNVRVAAARVGFARTLGDLKKFQEAEAEFLEVERVYAIAQGISKDRRKQYLESVVAFYEAWDKAEPGKDAAQKAKQRKAALDELVASMPVPQKVK